jgi:hypothetical protein
VFAPNEVGGYSRQGETKLIARGKNDIDPSIQDKPFAGLRVTIAAPFVTTTRQPNADISQPAPAYPTVVDPNV